MIAVVGGGAAGFFAAITAASNGQKVVLLEAGNKLLAKVRISGGGRCNVTNGAETLMNLLDGYPRGHKELRGPFTRFNNQHTMQWFEDRGVSLKTEPDGRVFPVSDDSSSIVECLLSEAKQYDIHILMNHRVEQIIPYAKGFKLIIGGSAMEVDKVIVTTGGGRDMNAFRWLSELGLEIIDPVPSLFTFNIPQSPFKELMGVAIPDVEVTIMNSKFCNRGPVLVTHWGLSGPAVLKLSSLAARYLSGVNYVFSIRLDFLPGESFESVMEIFNDQKKKHPRQTVSSFRMEKFTARFWLRLIQLSGIPLELDWGNVSKAQLRTLVETTKNSRLQVRGKTTFKEEFVTSGGISLKEIDFKTMESKKIPGLYFAGEVLDIDGVTGGYNFQAAWTTAFIAGESAAG
ncbi:MAG: NAD(P)/FAD-dependent oxidoreductase [Bacteroidota bacterium]